MKTQNTPIARHGMTLAAPFTAALLMVLMLFQLADIASAAPGPSPESGQQQEAVTEPGVVALLPANAVSVELRSHCYTETEGGVSAVITNHSGNPQQVHISAVEPPITTNAQVKTDVTVPASSTAEHMLGSWANGSYIVAGARHDGIVKTQADFTVDCGQPEPFAKAYSTCMWPGGRHIWVEIGNTGTADAVFDVSYLKFGDDFVIATHHTIAPGDSFTLDHPVQESGTWLVRVRVDGSLDPLVDETIVIDCVPVDDTVTPPENPAQEPEQESAGTDLPSVDSARPEPQPGGRNLPALTVVGENKSAGSLFGLDRVVSALMNFVALLLKTWV